MNDTPDFTLAAPTIEQKGQLILAGLIQTFAMTDIGDIPALWEEFAIRERALTNIVDPTCAYGASLSFSEEKGCEYMAAVEVTAVADVPGNMQTAVLQPATYAVFRQPGHISLMPPTIGAVWSQWLPASGYVASEKPLVEFYPPAFDPVTGNGGFEVWLPVLPKPD